MINQYNTPPSDLSKIGLGDVTDADVDAYFRTAAEDPRAARDLALGCLATTNQRLALRILQREHETGLPVDALTLAGIIAVHANNKQLAELLD